MGLLGMWIGAYFLLSYFIANVPQKRETYFWVKQLIQPVFFTVDKLFPNNNLRMPLPKYVITGDYVTATKFRYSLNLVYTGSDSLYLSRENQWMFGGKTLTGQYVPLKITESTKFPDNTFRFGGGSHEDMGSLMLDPNDIFAVSWLSSLPVEEELGSRYGFPTKRVEVERIVKVVGF